MGLAKIVLLLVMTLWGWSAEKKVIFILHSYAQEYPWTKNQHQGFVEQLQKQSNMFQIYAEDLDTKRLAMTPEYEESFARYLQMKYKEVKPDIIYVTDDNALSFMREKKEEIFPSERKIPVFFSGVNNLGLIHVLPKDTYVGVYEVKEIKPNIELIKQFSPQTRDIWIVGDRSTTYQAIFKELQLQQGSFPNITFHYISSNTITDIQKELPTKPRSFVLLTTIGELKDSAGHTLLPHESIAKMSENKNIIIVSMEDAYMVKGVIGGYVTSGISQGKEAANLVMEYLRTDSLKAIQSLIKSPNIYLFNASELINARVILSEYTARNATILGEGRDFLENNRSMVANILTILLVGLLFFFMAVYAMQRHKYSQLPQQLQEFEDLQDEFYKQQQFIDKLFEGATLGYWRLNPKTEQLFVSTGLQGILGIHNNIYQDDSNLVTYFMHADDKRIYDEAFLSVKDTQIHQTFKHRMVNAHNEIFTVTHTIYQEENRQGNSTDIVGIIRITA